ncbi:MAG: hypothetical protein IJG23_04200 [Clostridia bacterium]|nr:hypothetical protein [Clostridia bacterium]
MNKRQAKKRNAVKFPVLNPKDFGMKGYDCMFIKPQADNTLVGLYVTQNLDDFHWLVVKGNKTARCDTLSAAAAYCKKQHYRI